MLKSSSERPHSNHQLKFNLLQTLKKEREMSNRITVLIVEKHKKIRTIQKQFKPQHSFEVAKCSRTLYPEKSTIKQLKLDQKIMHNKSLKNQIQIGIKSKKKAILELNQERYNEIRKRKELNETKIGFNRQKCLQLKKNNKNRVKLMELHGRTNIKRFWDGKLEYILEKKNKENEQKYNLYENSLLNISILQEKENKLLEDIQNTIIFENNLIDETINFGRSSPLQNSSHLHNNSKHC